MPNLSLKELKEIAENRGIKVYEIMSKDIIASKKSENNFDDTESTRN